MKKIFFLYALSGCMLFGCSQEIEQEDALEMPTSTEVVNPEVVDSEMQITTEGELITTEEEAKGNELNNSEKKEIATEIETSNEGEKAGISEETAEKTADENTDYYEMYKSSLDTNSELGVLDENGELTETIDGIVYKSMSEDIVEMPLLANNEIAFEENVEKLPLSQLEEIGAITYIEEPITKMYLIDLNLAFLNESYPAESYSLIYNGVEYGVFISEENPNYGVILIQSSEGSLDDIKINGIFNVLK